MSSFAKTISPSPIEAASPRPAFNGERSETSAQMAGRGSAMVAKDAPHPVPRPSPDMAHDVDRTTFNARWSAEAHEAKAARKAAFKEKRTQAQPKYSRAFVRAKTR